MTILRHRITSRTVVGLGLMTLFLSAGGAAMAADEAFQIALNRDNLHALNFFLSKAEIEGFAGLPAVSPGLRRKIAADETNVLLVAIGMPPQRAVTSIYFRTKGDPRLYLFDELTDDDRKLLKKVAVDNAVPLVGLEALQLSFRKLREATPADRAGALKATERVAATTIDWVRKHHGDEFADFAQAMVGQYSLTDLDLLSGTNSPVLNRSVERFEALATKAVRNSLFIDNASTAKWTPAIEMAIVKGDVKENFKPYASKELGGLIIKVPAKTGSTSPNFVIFKGDGAMAAKAAATSGGVE